MTTATLAKPKPRAPTRAKAAKTAAPAKPPADQPEPVSAALAPANLPRRRRPGRRS